jgi:hypothetical protein
MFSDWEDDDGPEAEWSAGSGWSAELSFGDPDAWRGRACADVNEAWRGGVHLVEWPVWDAGPEYFMWKRLAEGEES